MDVAPLHYSIHIAKIFRLAAKLLFFLKSNNESYDFRVEFILSRYILSTI